MAPRAATAPPPPPPAKPKVAEFSARELSLSRAQVWGVKPAMIRAALRTAGKDRVSVAEGEQIVNNFRSLIVGGRK